MTDQEPFQSPRPSSFSSKVHETRDNNNNNNNNNNLLIYSALFNIPGDQKRITTIINLKLYKY